MSLWSKFRKWYEPKFRVTNYDTYPFETEELPSSPLARLVRKLAKHWIGIITTIGVVFTVIATIYTVRAFYAIPQAPQPQSIPAKPTANPKEAFTDKKIIMPDDAKLHNQSPATNRINDKPQVSNRLKDKLIPTVIAQKKDPTDKLLPSEAMQSLSDFSPKVDFKYIETESGQVKEKEKTNRINHYLSNVGGTLRGRWSLVLTYIG